MLTQDQLDQQVTQGSEYLIRGGNIERWFHSKDFEPKDEEYIRVALGYET